MYIYNQAQWTININSLSQIAYALVSLNMFISIFNGFN